MSTVSSVGAGSNSLYASDTLSGSAKVLDQNAFLQLLVKQIQFQDPMNPKSNTDMAAQMAQFTALQQASQSSSSLGMLQASSLMGNTVMLQVDQNSVTTGVVSGVTMVGGKPQIVVNGTPYNLNQVLTVEPTVATPPGSTSPTNSPAN